MLRSLILPVIAAIALSYPAKSTPFTNSTPMNLKRISKVLREVPLIDGHNDLPWQLRKYEGLDKVNLRESTEKLSPRALHTDIPRLRNGKVGAQFWAVYVPPELTGGAAVKAVIEQIDLVKRMTAQYSDTFELALSAGEIERIHRKGKIASIIAMEGGHSIENSLGVLRVAYELGARYMTLTHVKNVGWADSANDKPTACGLTPFGEDVVREMNRLGMMVDLSHVSDQTMRAALKVSKAPVIFSHSSVRAICNDPRNVPDDVLLSLAQNKGIIMVTFLPGYLTEAGRLHAMEIKKEEERLEALYPKDVMKYEAGMRDWKQAHPMPARPTVADVADHIDYVRKLIGIEHVGIGSDFDGFTGAPEGLEDVSCFPALLSELMCRGYSDADIKKVAGQNLLRVFKDVEKIAAELK